MIKSPILVVGCARSGTTLLYNIISEVSSIWSIGIESKAIIERYHSPVIKGWESGELAASDLTVESREYILNTFRSESAPGDFWRRVNHLRTRLNQTGIYRAIKTRGRSSAVGSMISGGLPEGGLAAVRVYVKAENWVSSRIFSSDETIRLLDKSPEHCLRLPFMAELFPDSKIIFIVRDGRANIFSLMEGWRHPWLFPGYETPMPVTSIGQSRGRWAFTLIPGWRDLVDSPLDEICANQWVACNTAVLDYAEAPNARPLLMVRYEDLITDPNSTLIRIADFLDLEPEDIPAIGQILPEINIVSKPGMEKWRREEKMIENVLPMIEPLMRYLGYSI